MNQIVVNKVQVTANRIDVYYKIEGEIKKHFNPAVPSFWCEYSVSIKDVPIGIAVIPFVCNVLPLVWLTDAELIVPELDRDFYLSVPDFKKGFEEMYPNVTFAGKMVVDSICEYNSLKKSDKKSALFFSGGVDATASLLVHTDEKPDLVTVWGADIRLEDKAGWENVRKHIQKVADDFGVKKIEIRSNFRTFIAPRFTKLSENWGGYWGGIQHGIGIIGHEAPCAFSLGHSVAYFASSYSPEYRKEHPWGSDPRIDEQICFCGIRIIHDQSEYNRQEKVDHIVRYVSEHHIELPLRVCWISSGGKNCCHCEKCYRTIMGLLAVGADPKRYGLEVTSLQLANIKSYLERQVWLSEGDVAFWKEIQNKFIEMQKKLSEMKELKWIYTYDFDKVNGNFYKRIMLQKQKVRKFLSLIKHEVIKY